MAQAQFPDLAVPGTVLTVKAVPGARRNAVTPIPGGLKAEVTAAPEKGRANAAVLALVAKALGVPKTRLTIVSGAASRSKRVRIEEA